MFNITDIKTQAIIGVASGNLSQHQQKATF